MLPKSIQYNEPHTFVTNERQGYRLVFASRENLLQARTTPTEPLWWFPCGDKRSLDAVYRWVRARRAQWQEWGHLVTTAGAAVFSRHIAQLMAAEPIQEVQGTVVNADDDPCVISIGQLLSGQSGLTTEILAQHRFESPAARDRFFKWFKTGRNSYKAEALLDIAFDKGTDALSSALEDLVRSKSPASSSAAC